MDEKYFINVEGKELEFYCAIWHDGPLLEIREDMAIIWYDCNNEVKGEEYDLCFLVKANTKPLLDKEIDLNSFIQSPGTTLCKKDGRLADKLEEIEVIKDFSKFLLPDKGIFL